MRLWNRAVNTLSHIGLRDGPVTGTSALSNPFDVSSDSGKVSPAKDENHSTSSSAILHHARGLTNGLEWEIAEGMLETTLSLASFYLLRGSVREAEYFIREAEQLASSMNAPALLCRALAMKVEVQLQLRQLDSALTTLRTATDALTDMMSPDAAKLHKLYGEHSELLLQDKDAQLQYTEALKMLEELDKMFPGLDGNNRHSFPFLWRSTSAHNSPDDQAFRCRVLVAQGEAWSRPLPLFFLQSWVNIVSSPDPNNCSGFVLIFALVWLLRNDIGDEYESLLQKLSQLAPLADIQVRVSLERRHNPI